MYFGYIMVKTLIAIIAAIIILPSLFTTISATLYTPKIEWNPYKKDRAIHSAKSIFCIR
jgi:hypothetical protein